MSLGSCGHVAYGSVRSVQLFRFDSEGRELVEVVREACLLAFVEVLPPVLMFGGRVVVIVPISVVDDDAREVVDIAHQFPETVTSQYLESVYEVYLDRGKSEAVAEKE